ncbi:MAG: SMI1/KNR4 family protein [Hyphomonadaceae bacterium]|nr:SMI1/KNR4 family protein [Hyphomonadaceae bacterium]
MRLRPTRALAPIAPAEVAAAEAALSVRFPTGYYDFITRYGRGVLGGLVRIYTPADVLNGPNNVREWRARIDEYWFWDASAALLPKARALECVVIADTVGGDELVFHPDQTDRLYVLAHDFDEAYLASDVGLEAAVDWFFTSGVIDEPFEDLSFEPY